MNKLLKEYAEYNSWANLRLISYLREYPHELIRKNVISSFPSIEKTLLHIWDGQILWLSRLNGHSPSEFPSHQYQSLVHTLYDGILITSEQLSEWIDEHLKTEEAANTEISYKRINGEPKQNFAFHMLMHVFNHSTYHRGQVVTMCKQLGFKEIPSTDLIYRIRLEQKANDSK